MQEVMQKSQALQKSVEESLKDSKGDPCYPVIFQKEYARQSFGSDLPWITCIPVRISAAWDVDEQYKNPSGMGSATGLVAEWKIHDNFAGSTDSVQYLMEESYSGYVTVTRDQKTRKKIESFSIHGPYPEDQKTNAKFKQISASLTGNYMEQRGMWALGSQTDTTKYKTYSTSSPSDFRIVEGGLISFTYSGGPSGKINAPEIEVIPENLVKDPKVKDVVRLLPDLPSEDISHYGVEITDLTIDDLKQLMKKGAIEKDVLIAPKQEQGSFAGLNKRGIYNLNGNIVTVKITLDEPGGLAVSPGDGLASTGPDDNDQFKPESKTYTLKNTGGSPIDFSVSKSKNWLKLSKSGGTLAPKASATVTVSIDQAVAKGMKEGTYTDSVSFANVTNAKGSTSRKMTLEVGEEQTWRVTLSGQETDDVGGKLMYMKIKDKWQHQVVSYGVRFNFKMAAEFTIKKKKGKWEYKKGRITGASVNVVDMFDPTIFFIKKIVCRNCGKVTGLQGRSLGGSVDGKTVRLRWPDVRPNAVAHNKLKVEHNSKDESHKGYSENEFFAECFFHWTWTHDLPLKDGEVPPFKKERESSVNQYRQNKQKPIFVYHQYFMKRIR